MPIVPVKHVSQFIPPLPENHLTVSQILAGENLKQVQKAQVKQYTGPYQVTAEPKPALRQIHEAQVLPIPLQTTRHSQILSVPKIEHPVTVEEHQAGMLGIVLVVVLGLLALFRDWRLDAQVLTK